MKSIGLVEAWVSCDAFEQEGNESGVVFVGEVTKDIAKLGRVSVAEVGWCFHADEDDVGVGVARACAFEDFLEVGFQFGDGQAAKGVVGAEFDDENGDGLLQGPVDASEAASRCLAADAGVDDAEWQGSGIDLVLNDAWVGVFCADAVSGCEAGPDEEDDAAGVASWLFR